jgi:phospholipid N-methyltransferase
MTTPSHLHLPRGTARKRSPDWLLFLAKFLRHGTAIASFVPSSRWLAQAVVRDIDFEKTRCIVELGAGTGPITEELLRRSGGRCRILVVERDPDFCRRLRERFPPAEVVQADANDLERLLDERVIDKIDHVVRGLPLPSFSLESRRRILAVVRRRLAASGTFRQLTHMPLIYYPLYHNYFERVEFRFIARNFPPGGFYICEMARLAPKGLMRQAS